MSTEHRLTAVEQAIVKQGESNETLIKLNQTAIAILSEQRESLAEHRRDAEQYRRWWTYLAKKHGWLDDEDWPPPVE